MEESARKKVPKLSGSLSAERLKAAAAKMATKVPITAKALITAGAARTQSIIQGHRRPARPASLPLRRSRGDGLLTAGSPSERGVHIHMYLYKREGERRDSKVGKEEGREERESGKE
jgi:hypothetical protein